ncbi:MAG TPA: ABC transporter permease, partial [Nitrososphaeria archaeon]|nr:ABC transporter permease [Nitrososphaeria archaeon]
LYSGLTAGSVMAVEEKERGTLRRLLASPATSTDMLVGKTLASLIVLALMSAFMIILGVFGCGAKIIWNPLRVEDWIAGFMIILVAVMMIGLGMLLSLAAKTVRSATNLSVVIGLMLAFMTGVWFPKWWLPGWMQILADGFPGAWAIDVARSILVYEAELAEVAGRVLEVLVAAIAIYLLGVLAYKKTLRRYAES